MMRPSARQPQDSRGSTGHVKEQACEHFENGRLLCGSGAGVSPGWLGTPGPRGCHLKGTELSALQPGLGLASGLAATFLSGFLLAHLLSRTTNVHQASASGHVLRHLPPPGMAASSCLHTNKSRPSPSAKGCAFCGHSTSVGPLLGALVTFRHLFSLYESFVSF